jgi:hypothetical protein
LQWRFLLCCVRQSRRSNICHRSRKSVDSRSTTGLTLHLDRCQYGGRCPFARKIGNRRHEVATFLPLSRGGGNRGAKEQSAWRGGEADSAKGRAIGAIASGRRDLVASGVPIGYDSGGTSRRRRTETRSGSADGWRLIFGIYRTGTHF